MLYREAGSDDGVDERSSRMLIPMHGFSEWGCRSVHPEEEMRSPMDLQWATRDEIDMVRNPYLKLSPTSLCF